MVKTYLFPFLKANGMGSASNNL